MNVWGVRLLGLNAETARRALLTLVALVIVLVARALLRSAARVVLDGRRWARAQFWTRQAINLFCAAALTLFLVSIWFDDPRRLTTAAGLVTAGLAFALQRVITALAGYVLILRGKTFDVGDRIRMGGVRGDVIRLDFLQTTILEMGQPPGEQQDDPSMWVKGRQFTGRIVTVSNGKIFDEPVYNYTRDFPWVWEEMTIPIKFGADRERAERSLIEAATRHAVRADAIDAESQRRLRERYQLELRDLSPRVYLRITDNWLELGLRFLVPDRGIREIKDAITRDVLLAFEQAQIEIASATYDITVTEKRAGYDAPT